MEVFGTLRVHLRRRNIAGLIVLSVTLVVGLSIFLTKVFGSATAQTIAGMTSAIIGGAAAVAAFLVVFEMRQDRRERSQPLILVNVAFTDEGQTWLSVANVGPGVAFDVSFEFDPVPVDYQGTKLTEMSLFQAPLPVMSPGAEHRQMLLLPSEWEEEVAIETRRFTSTARYRGEGGKEYERSYRFDLDRFIGMDVPFPTTEESLAKLVKIAQSWKK